MLDKFPVSGIVPSTDLARSRDFYTNKLGLAIDEENSSDQILMVKAGANTVFGVYPKPEGNKAEHTQLGFMVTDIENLVKELTEKGVVFEKYDMEQIKTNELGIVEFENAKSAFFKDPDGNIFSINQM